MIARTWPAYVFLSLFAVPLRGAEIQRPFVLWNKQDIAAIKARIETEPWAKAIYEANLKKPPENEGHLFELLHFAVTSDARTGERQKQLLLKMVRSPDPQGGAQWLNVVRFDLLHGLLTDAEKKEIEKVFRAYIEQAIFQNAVLDPAVFNDSANYSRYDKFSYTRSNWLPNIIFPRKISANLMAAALADEALIRKTWGHYGSLQWYFDEYLADTGFYGEEFSKMGATPGELLLYCRAVQRLGLNGLGFGYQGRHGATMRGHIESVIRLGYPRVEMPGGIPHYPMVTSGDLRRAGSSNHHRHPTFAFQHFIVNGFLADGQGEIERWKAHGAWGGEIRGKSPQWDGFGGFTPHMQVPLWFEIGQQQWPDAGFDYFLAQMRTPGQEKYIPSLYFGLEPIDPKSVKAPSARSYLAPQRGLAVLRAEESPRYWESPAPAVCLRLAAPYAHSVNDSFALAGYYAFNRPIYLNRQVGKGYASGYSRSVLSHCGVMVDGKEPAFTDDVITRHGFYPPVKYLTARSSKVFEGIEQSRSLFLTNEYLLDVFALTSSKPHSYLWLVHALGNLPFDDAQPLPEMLKDFGAGRSLTPNNQGWDLTVTQTCGLADPTKAVLPKAWYERRIGVKLSMLESPGTTVYLAKTPADTEAGPDSLEVGGVSVIDARQAERTRYVALHEPFENGKPKIARFEGFAETADAVAVRIGEPGHVVNDRVMVQRGDCRAPVTLTAGGEEFVFSDHAFIRIEADSVSAWGDLRRLKLRVTGEKIAFTLNGRQTRATMENGSLVFDPARK